MSSYHIRFTDEETEIQKGDLSSNKGVSSRCRERLHLLRAQLKPPLHPILSSEDSQSCLWDLRDALLQHLCAPQDISVSPKVRSAPSYHSHLALPPLLCHTFQSSWRNVELAPTPI